MKSKVVYIVGPTASGKTDLAFEIANKYLGELISADSVQVYKRLDIVSGKDIPDGYSFVPLPQFSKEEIYAGYFSNSSLPPIYLLDLVEPRFPFTVSHFQNLASEIVNFIEKKGKLPVVVGGTGLYVNSLINGLDSMSKPDIKLRKKLDALSVAELQKMVPQEIFNSLNDSDKNNRRRLVRKIEMGDSSSVISSGQPKNKYDNLVIGLYCEREQLKKRIDMRVAKRLEQGATEEMKSLFQDYENLAQQVKDANGYKQLFAYLKGEVSFEEAIYRWKISEYHHAKNQMTWFRKYGNVEWFDIEQEDYERKIENRLKKFLK